MRNVTPWICLHTNSKNRDSRQLNSARGQETGTVKNSVLFIEIINNTRVVIEGKKWERGYWGANSSPGCSLIHGVPGEKVVLGEFSCFLKCFSS